ncbi:MAG: Tfp pilus assembly protein FimT/FimU [Mariprofundaceae bacterium]
MYPSLRFVGGSSQVWQRGFTLIELIATLGILVILLTVAGGFYSRWREDTRVDAAKEKVVSILQQARLRALSQRSSQAVIFDYNNDTVSFDYNGDGLIQAVAEVEQFPSVDLQDYVCGACGPGVNNTETVNFTTRGTSGNLTVQINSVAADKVYYVVLNSVTGRVDIRRSCTSGQCQ